MFVRKQPFNYQVQFNSVLFQWFYKYLILEIFVERKENRFLGFNRHLKFCSGSMSLLYFSFTDQNADKSIKIYLNCVIQYVYLNLITSEENTEEPPNNRLKSNEDWLCTPKLCYIINKVYSFLRCVMAGYQILPAWDGSVCGVLPLYMCIYFNIKFLNSIWFFNFLH